MFRVLINALLLLLHWSFLLKAADNFEPLSSSTILPREIKPYEVGSIYSLNNSKEIWILIRIPKDSSIAETLTTTFLKIYAWDNLKDDPAYRDYSWPYLHLSCNNQEIDNRINGCDLERMIRTSTVFVFIPDLPLENIYHNSQDGYAGPLLLTQTDMSVAAIKNYYIQQNHALKNTELTLIAVCKKCGTSKQINYDSQMIDALKHAIYTRIYALSTGQVFWDCSDDEEEKTKINRPDADGFSW